MHRLAALALLLLLARPGGALAQEDPPPTSGVPQAPVAATPEPSGGDAPGPKGPNLQTPMWLTGAQKAQLEAAVALWDEAYAQFHARGPQAARPKIDEAMVALRAARGLDPRLAIPDHYLGIAYQLTGDFQQAVARLRDATKKNPRFQEAMVELGDAYRWAKQPDDASRTYDEAIALAPEYAHAYEMRALLRVSRGQLDRAREDLRQAKTLAPEVHAFDALLAKVTLVLDGPAWPRKFTAETRNYIVWTNVDQAVADDIAANAELIRRLYTQIFDRPPRARRKSSIIVFATREEYHGNGGPQNAGGHFDPAFKQLYLFRYQKPSDTLLVLYHEGFHQFLDQLLEEGTDVPQWFNEGLADFFGPSEHVTEGQEGMRIRPNPWRLNMVKQMIRDEKAVPFERLMTMTQAEMYEPRSAATNYAEAWSIVYFLCQADERAHFDLVKDYFQALRRGKDLRECFTAAFGHTDMKALEARWREYMLGVQ